MMLSNTLMSDLVPSFSSLRRSTFTAALAVAALCAAPLYAQDSAPAESAQPPAAAAPQATPENTISNQKPQKTRKGEEKIVQSKDTKKEVKKNAKVVSLAGLDPKLPDKQLYDKAEDAIKHGRFDVGRLDLQTLLNTYPDTQYMMPAKLAIADSWYKEGGEAALTQAEQEYKDFITFFPNAPEAAEAQMRVGDIYFRQMDKPDRDYTKTTQAEQEYRLMLQQFPDSALVPQARLRLLEVQEVLAGREADIAAFYYSRSNWPAAIARYQTVIDTYPEYSHMDDVLVTVGDAYEAEAKFVRTLRLPEAGKARLVQLYETEAADAYRKVILEHSAAPHVEDARDRLVGMNLPVPTPTPEQIAASTALENSRGQYTLAKRASLIFLHQADTVHATIGEPPLEDAKPTLAPQIVRQAVVDFNNSMNPAAADRPGAQQIPAAHSPAAPDQAAPSVAAPMSLQDVPAADNTGSTAPAMGSTPQSAPAMTSGSAGASMGVEIVQPAPGSSTAPVTAPATPPAFPGTAPAAAVPAPDPTGGIKAVGPSTANTVMAPIEKPATAPDAINEVTPGSQKPVAVVTPTNGKKPKVACDKSDESCSNKKKKKGIAKINPF